MIEIGQTTKRISKDYRLIIQGNPEEGNKELVLQLPLYIEDKQVDALEVILRGQEFNQFYDTWKSDGDLFGLLKSKGLIPQEIETPQEDLLNKLEEVQLTEEVQEVI
jgi:hypothetical protein